MYYLVITNTFKDLFESHQLSLKNYGIFEFDFHKYVYIRKYIH